MTSSTLRQSGPITQTNLTPSRTQCSTNAARAAESHGGAWSITLCEYFIEFIHSSLRSWPPTSQHSRPMRSSSRQDYQSVGSRTMCRRNAELQGPSHARESRLHKLAADNLVQEAKMSLRAMSHTAWHHACSGWSLQRGRPGGRANVSCASTLRQPDEIRQQMGGRGRSAPTRAENGSGVRCIPASSTDDSSRRRDLCGPVQIRLQEGQDSRGRSRCQP